MDFLIVVNNPNDWPLDIPGVELVSAKTYLTEAAYNERRGAKVFNLCRSYRYQSMGYYVSLLAAARGHKPLPSITTIQDLKLQNMIRLAGEDLEELIQSSLARVKEREFTLSVYFGKNIEKKYDRLALALFNAFPAPLLRAKFEWEEEEGDGATKRRGDAGGDVGGGGDGGGTPNGETARVEREAAGTAVPPGGGGAKGAKGRWELKSLGPIAASDIPKDHWLFMLYAVNQYFVSRHAVK